jgi:hypothetical protein
MPRTNESKYGKKTTFSREKQYVYSEAEINRNNNKLDEWKQTRKQEREENLRIASGEAIAEKDEKKEKKEKKEKEKVPSGQIVREDLIMTTYYTKMNFVMHDIPLSYNIDNVMRSFQYFGSVQYVRSKMNEETSTYTVTIVAGEWKETIKDIQANIFNKGFAIIDKYRITADDTQPVNEYGEQIEIDE